jgi:hypothetical protein
VLRGSGTRVASRLGGTVGMLLLGATISGAAPPWPVDPDSVGTLEGHLRWQGRDPVVILSRDGWRLGDARVSPDGTFLLAGVPAGRHALVVRGRDCLEVQVPVLVKAKEVTWIELDLPCPPYPCRKLDKSDPGCIARYPELRARLGKPCEVHPKRRLELDVVPIHYGIAGFHPSGGDPRTQFPNAHVVASFGCVIGFERWAEVTYCQDCRRAFYWHNPRYLLQPIRPLPVTRVAR